MTPPSPTEVAALRERLADALIRRSFDLCHVTRADIRAALALLDAQAAEIARLTAALQEIADRHIGDQPASSPLSEEAWARRCNVDLRRIAIRALAPAPAPEVAG